MKGVFYIATHYVSPYCTALVQVIPSLSASVSWDYYIPQSICNLADGWIDGLKEHKRINALHVSVIQQRTA